MRILDDSKCKARKTIQVILYSKYYCYNTYDSFAIFLFSMYYFKKETLKNLFHRKHCFTLYIRVNIYIRTVVKVNIMPIISIKCTICTCLHKNVAWKFWIKLNEAACHFLLYPIAITCDAECSLYSSVSCHAALQGFSFSYFRSESDISSAFFKLLRTLNSTVFCLKVAQWYTSFMIVRMTYEATILKQVFKRKLYIDTFSLRSSMEVAPGIKCNAMYSKRKAKFY